MRKSLEGCTHLERTLVLIAVVAITGLFQRAHAYNEADGQQLIAGARPILTYCRELSDRFSSPNLAGDPEKVFLACLVAAAAADNEIPNPASVADQLRILR